MIPSLHGKQMGKQCKQWWTFFSWAPKSLQMVTAAIKFKDACSLGESYDQPRQHRHYFANQGPSSQSYGFSSSYVEMWKLDYKESWVLKNWCFWTMVLEDSWESLGLHGDQISQFWRKSVLNINWKDWCWSWNSNTQTTWYKELTHWKRPWCWERWKAGGEGDDKGWDVWMASLIQ